MRHIRSYIVTVITVVLLTPVFFVAFSDTAKTESHFQDQINALSTRVSVLEGFHGPEGTPDPSPTATEPATPTDVPPTATDEPTATEVDDGELVLGWHPPGSHSGVSNPHEHGTAPPQWVLDSDNQPFTQDRESHTGYKAFYDVSPGGAESYFTAHVIATNAARSHGDHDYQLWIRDPETAQVFYVDGVLCFAAPCESEPVTALNDTGERPLIFSVNDGGCETWYSDPSVGVIDVGWTVCGRYEKFSGPPTDGDGSFRGVDWIMQCGSMPAGHPLRDNCRTEFGAFRLTWDVNGMEFDPADIAEPIN